jgi:hypothetical protein
LEDTINTATLATEDFTTPLPGFGTRYATQTGNAEELINNMEDVYHSTDNAINFSGVKNFQFTTDGNPKTGTDSSKMEPAIQ